MTPYPPPPAGADDDLVEDLARRCRLGAARSWSIITTGYEDTNLDLDTTTGRYVIKLFGPDPTRTRIATRTTELILRARIRGVRHPRLIPATDGTLLHPTRAGTALVMERAAAQDFYTLGREPHRHEIASLLHQAALLHTLDVHPEPVFDPWAIPNLDTLADHLDPLLDPHQRDLVHTARAAMADTDHTDLPRMLIHGDLTKGNVLADPTGSITLIDFSCADRHPRVQELAVIAANLTHGDPTPILDRAEQIAELYPTSRGIPPLTPAEHTALPAYTCAAAAMEFLGATRELDLADRRDADTAEPGGYASARHLETIAIHALGLAGLEASVAGLPTRRARTARRPSLGPRAPLHLLDHLDAEHLVAEAQDAAHGIHWVTIEHGDPETDDDIALLRQLHDLAWSAPSDEATVSTRGGNDYWSVRVGGPAAVRLIDQIATLANQLNPGWWHIRRTSR